MNRVLIVFLSLLIACAPSEEEIQAQIDEAVEEAVEEAEAVEEEEEDAVGLVEKMLKHPSDKKKKIYFVTDDDDRDIYAVLENGDPSDEPVGKLVGKTGRAKWFLIPMLIFLNT